MEFPHILDPTQVRIATAAGLGSFVFLMVTRRLGWFYVLTLFLVGQITAYYFTEEIATWRGWSMESYGVIGFTIGLLGMLFWGAVLTLAQSLHDDPRGTVTWLYGLWKGRGNSNQGGGNP